MSARQAKKRDERTGLIRRFLASHEHDLVTMGIAFAAILLFVGTASLVLPGLVKAWSGRAAAPDIALTNALILNIALILLGWHRFKVLNAELKERTASEREARRLADIDHLTGCHNRRSFTATLGSLLASLDRRESTLAVIAIDLDNFKQVNDLHGHLAGDEVLCATARRIEGLLPFGGVVARIGGDEFVCVVPYDQRMPDRIDQLATRMIEPGPEWLRTRLHLRQGADALHLVCMHYVFDPKV